jgi:gas vesicle protein
MRDYEFDDDEPFVVIEKEAAGVGPFLLGALIGAGIGLLFAPRSGDATRREITRSARRVKEAAQTAAQDAAARVSDTFQEARRQVEERIDAARLAIELKKDQVNRAVDAGREAARDARDELERRIAETKAETNAAYEAGRGVSRRSRIARNEQAVGPAASSRTRVAALDDDDDGV